MSRLSSSSSSPSSSSSSTSSSSSSAGCGLRGGRESSPACARLVRCPRYSSPSSSMRARSRSPPSGALQKRRNAAQSARVAKTPQPRGSGGCGGCARACGPARALRPLRRRCQPRRARSRRRRPADPRHQRLKHRATKQRHHACVSATPIAQRHVTAGAPVAGAGLVSSVSSSASVRLRLPADAIRSSAETARSHCLEAT